jgi:DNA-binding Lrp family transcriptional regulator
MQNNLDIMDKRYLNDQLLEILREDARISLADLSRKLKISRTTAYSRIKRLEDSGIIRGYTVRLSNSIDEKEVRAHVLVTSLQRYSGRVETALKRLKGVRSIYSVSGPYDIIVMLSAPSVGELDDMLDKIGIIDGVERTTSSIILATKLDR